MCLWLNITPIFHTKQLFNYFRITCFRMKEQTWYHILKNKTNSRSHFSHTLFWSHQRFFEKKYNLKICLNEQRIKENFYRTFYVLNNNYWFSTFFRYISVNPSGPCFKKNERLGNVNWGCTNKCQLWQNYMSNFQLITQPSMFSLT